MALGGYHYLFYAVEISVQRTFKIFELFKYKNPCPYLNAMLPNRHYSNIYEDYSNYFEDIKIQFSKFRHLGDFVIKQTISASSEKNIFFFQ